MTHIIKNNKWILTTSLVGVFVGVLTFFTFINKSFIELNEVNIKILLFIDIIMLILFFSLIIWETYKILKRKKEGKLGSETNLRYITFFSTTTLLPSILIAIFSLLMFNVVFQKYFEKKIKSVVNNSSEVAKNYIEQTKNSIESDILLMLLDINNNSSTFYDNPKRFLNSLATQRLLRKLDEVYLLDSSGNIIMSSIKDPSIDFVPPPEESFALSLEGKSIRITDPSTNRTSALAKLNNFIDTYLYIVKFMDPKVMKYLQDTDQLVGIYYSVQDKKTGIKITFAIIYIFVVSLLLFLSVNLAINFATRLTKPIVNLINASERISDGNLDTKVPNIETNDEFIILNKNFNSMIDKLKIQQDKLLLSERYSAWEDVARKLAHEIKNPLTPIQLSIDRLKEKYLNKVGNEGKNFSSYLETISKQIKDIEFLVNEFSDFARMPKPNLKKNDIRLIISEVLNLHKLSEPSIDFQLTKTKNHNYVNGDKEQLNRVFLNLIKNSIESIHEKINKSVDFVGKINIDIRQDSDYIYIKIFDNGLGFGQINKTKMLTPYFTTKKDGTGLGLAIVSKIVNDHNGIIVFNSINEGAEVEITVPKY